MKHIIPLFNHFIRPQGISVFRKDNSLLRTSSLSLNLYSKTVPVTASQQHRNIIMNRQPSGPQSSRRDQESRPSSRVSSSKPAPRLPLEPSELGSNLSELQISQDTQTVRNYFQKVQMPLDPQFEEHRVPQSVRGGGAQQYFTARLDIPIAPGRSLSVRTDGTNKKTARQNLYHTVSERLESEGLLVAAEPKRRRRGKPARSGGSGGAQQEAPRTNINRAVPEEWDSLPLQAISSKAPQHPSAFKNSVPVSSSAWDDDEELPASISVSGGPRGESPVAALMGKLRISTPATPRGKLTIRETAPAFQSRQPQNAQAQNGTYSRPDNWQAGDPRDGSWQPSLQSLGPGAYVPPLARGQGGPRYQQEHRAPPMQHRLPIPNATLPRSIDDVEKKFVTYYCNQQNLPVPKPSFRHASGRKHDPGHWECHYHLPPHTFEGQSLPMLNVLGQAKGKKAAQTRGWSNLTTHLLAIVNQQYVDLFRLHSVPPKKRIADMLEQPIQIDLAESNLARLDNMLSQLKDADAFAIQEAEMESESFEPLMDFGNDGGSFASGPRLRQVEPHQIEIPQELLKNELPIFTKYQEIMAAIESNPVTILSAETGAGKTTQLPQFILSHIAQERKFLQNDPARPAPANIVVTQPRRIAAISVAQRVASERGEVIGRRSNVGYQVRFDDKRPTSDPESGHLIFCTSGILLKRLQENPSLTNVTHVILDEVHERDLNTDLLLIIVRHLLKRRPDLRVILMSATAETKLFQDYFRGFGSDPKSNLLPPVIAVPGRMFPVEKHFLEDVENLLYKRDALPVPFRPAKESLSWARNEMGSMIPPRGEDPVPYDYLEALIAHICGTRPEGAILCFLPGWQEIDTMMQRLKEDKTYRIGFSNEAKYRIYPLHSSIPTSAQQLIFDTPPKGVRKIILSTNIAETSVTINDVVYVVDAAKLRINSYDADRRISSLSSVWAATSNLRQRAGRAGRCQPGQYFSLLSHRRKESLPFSMPPELLRVDLQSTVLKIKALRLARRVADVFAAAPQPPSPGNVRTAMQELQKLGALTRDENLTSIGRVLANMPVDPWIGKMVLEAALLGCLDPILTLAGGMEIGRGVFAIHPDEKEQGRAHILAKFAVGTQSDHLTTLAAFSAWKSVAEAGGLGSRSFIPEAKDFARTNYLHYNSMANIERARQQLVRSLEDAGFVSRQRAHGPRSTAQLGGAERNIHANNAGMVRAILGGALYPNIAEVTAKDEYRSRYERVLRLTGSSVNSWKGVVSADKALQAGPSNGRCAPGSASNSDVFDYDTIPDDNDDTASLDVPTGAAPPPLPPRILAFQDKQRVDGALYMRSTTRVDPIALVLFADPQTVVRDTTELDKPAFWVDDWLQIRVPSVYHLRVLQELKMWMEKYLTWVFWAQSRANSRKSIDAEERKRMEQLGSMLIREIAALVEAANSNDLYRY